jgi:aryl-alcohol dehydrogenase-like predicted oxidoreductase
LERFDGRERHGGQSAPRGVAATGRGTTSEGAKPRDGSAWNKADRAKAEQGVERLRKPEDAAQPGQVSPAQVAAFIRRRRRATNPMEGWHVMVPVLAGPHGSITSKPARLIL